MTARFHLRRSVALLGFSLWVLATAGGRLSESNHQSGGAFPGGRQYRPGHARFGRRVGCGAQAKRAGKGMPCFGKSLTAANKAIHWM